MKHVTPSAKQVFIEAIEKPSPSEVARYLDRACRGDAGLRARVEQLLEAHQNTGQFLGGSGDVEIEANPIAPQRFGRYTVTGVISQGGFGVVYLGHDTQLRREVAIKVPHRERIKSTTDADAYLTEARTVARLDHPNIVPVFDVGQTDDGVCYIVSKFVAGGDLTRLIAEHPRHDQVVELVTRVADALHYAHQRGLVHRDVKPANLLRDKAGQPLLADFGLAFADQSFGRGSPHCGTPAYMSPEQARGEGHRVDARSDIYSLGVVFYELLTGRRPYRSTNTRELFDEIATGEIRPLRQLDDKIPKELDRICLKALARRASDRYSTALDLADDLRHWLAEQAAEVGGGKERRRKGETDPPATAAAEELASKIQPLTPATSGSDPFRKPHSAFPSKVVPKGLRSFDEHDADFFLELLPGPRNRDGLPDGIRFWKTKIEETDADKTFSVGLIYGPSGCGKSSLIKAGLLPGLAGHVLLVYLEATSDDTETRLLKGLRKICGAGVLPGGGAGSPHQAAAQARPEEAGAPRENGTAGELVETLAALRHGCGLATGQKVLIVLDQFEQWLHAHREMHMAELVRALRHCDGGRVQCIVMVCDDFWMAASRFMDVLEIPLVQGHNSAAADLFDTRHPRKVLTLFGRALGSLPAEGELSGAAELFLDQAVAGLAEDSKVVSVRLSLFAEMVKGKPWTPATLVEIGGIAGVGATFLDETFSASTAPPRHRLHQQAARGVLKALLPDADADIKGHRRSSTELLAAAGYERRPSEFAELLRILDAELRLITPADEESAEPRANDGACGETSGKAISSAPRSYQLTHDYLVPSLRDWLTRKQRETRRGRAELRLAEPSAAFSAKPDARFLPSWWEWPNILLFTKRGKWTPPERRVMQATGKYHGLRFTGLLVLVAIALFMGLEAYRRVELQRANDFAAAEQARAETLAESVFTARAEGVPYALDNLRPLGHVVVAFLRERLDDAQGDPVRRLHAAYALADNGQTPWKFLIEAVPMAPAAECRNLVAALEHEKALALPELARRAASAADAGQKARHAIVALHLGDPQPAIDALEVRSDPIHRTTLIHAYAGWRGEVSTSASLLNDKDNSAFRSGLCAALGTIAYETLEPAERNDAARVLAALYIKAPDGGTHAAAGWALRQWKQDLPMIAPTSRPPSDRRWFVNGQGMTMVEIAAGKFTMGTAGDGGVNQVSAQEVTLTRPFMLADREVTVDQFQRVVDDAQYAAAEKPAAWQQEFEQWKQYAPATDCPANNVNWSDAVLYCNWLSTREGRKPCYERTGEKVKIKDYENQEHDCEVWRCEFAAEGYRLPTEAEWEFAARAGSTGGFCYGSDEDFLPQYAWFVVNAKSRTWLGGAKLPNALGLFDMHGNVWEWCWDWMGNSSGEPVSDPTGPVAGSGRVLRGGAFFNNASDCQSASRGVYHPVFRYGANGFRVLCGR